MLKMKITALAATLTLGWATTAQAVEIEYWQYFFDARVAAMEQLIENFEGATPDITVTMTHFPYADYRTKVAAAIPAGEEPVTSIGVMDEPQAAFKAGRAGMHIDGSFRIGSLDGTRGLEWGVAELPANAEGARANYSSYWVNAITTKAEGEKYAAAVKFTDYLVSGEAMQIWLDVVCELPAKPSVGMTDANASDAVYGPFIRGLEYANTTKFANENGQRQLMVEMVERVQLEGMDPAGSLAIAAQAEQKILDGYYGE